MHSISITQLFIRFLKQNKGGILIEAALIFPILLISLAGILELSQYIQTTERLNSIANQVANAISTSPTFDVTELDKIIKAGVGMGYPYSPSVRVVICKHSNEGTLVDISDDTMEISFSGGSGIGAGRCGFGSGTGAEVNNPVCEAPNAVPNGYGQQVKVAVRCRYYPMADILGFVNSGINVRREIAIPMRESILP